MRGYKPSIARSILAQQYLDPGFDQLYFHTAGDQHQLLLDYGRDVLPELNEKNLVKTH